jgi:hypothetical protein
LVFRVFSRSGLFPAARGVICVDKERMPVRVRQAVYHITKEG